MMKKKIFESGKILYKKSFVYVENFVKFKT